MRSLNRYINEKFQVGKDNIRTYAYEPKDRNELIECIKDKIFKEGLGTEDNPLDLNDIDTSEITDMTNIFDVDEGELIELSKNGYFDISDWDVSNVKYMGYMFCNSEFDGDISKWDVSNVDDMTGMFYCSDFNGDISGWDVSKVRYMDGMFEYSNFTGKNGDISVWNVSKVEQMRDMFSQSKFRGNISKWDVSHVRNMSDMFYNSPLEKNPPKWYRE